jgi:hypothetical protein
MTLGYGVIFLMVMLASPAISKNFCVLTRMLYVAFLAEQGAAVCTAANPAIAGETSGPMGNMHDYAQHIKAEVTAGLKETETLSLLKSAAQSAKPREAYSDWLMTCSRLPDMPRLTEPNSDDRSAHRESARTRLPETAWDWSLVLKPIA